MNRISKRLQILVQKDNRLSKYFFYAIGEIILIAIGILIALEISNWNEDRKNQEEIKSILVLLRDNLNDDKAELENNLGIGNNFLNYWHSVLKENPADSGFTNLINKLGVYDFNSNNSGYLSALRGNKLSLIKNRDLINTLTTYYELKFREMENRALAFGRQTLILTNKIFDSLSKTEGIKNINKRTQLVIDDPVFKETLIELIGTTEDLLKKINERAEQAGLLVKSIDVELSEKQKK